MRRRLAALILFLAAGAALAEPRDPLTYPLKQWLFMLGLALFGGLASWITKVRKGTVAAHNIMALIGELTVSAFAGIVTFFGCEHMGLAPLLTAATVAMAGHLGAKAIAWVEALAEKKARDAGLVSRPAPLDDDKGGPS